MAVASAVLYASLHLIPDNHANIPPLSFFTGQMPFLPPNQQRQSTEGRISTTDWQEIEPVEFEPYRMCHARLPSARHRQRCCEHQTARYHSLYRTRWWSVCHGEIFQMQSLGQSSRGKYPYFWKYPNFPKTQCTIARGIKYAKKTRDYFDATLWRQIGITPPTAPPGESICIKTGNQIGGWVFSSFDHVIRGGPKYTIFTF